MSKSMHRIHRLVFPAALALLSVSCSSGHLDPYFRSGRHLEVVRAFEADSTHRYRERSLYQAGLSYAAAESPAYDPARSRVLLEELVARYPEGRYRRMAEPVLALLRERERLAEQVTDANTGAESLHARIVQMQKEVASLRARVELLGDSLQLRDRRIQVLEKRIADLKRIDLRH